MNTNLHSYDNLVKYEYMTDLICNIEDITKLKNRLKKGNDVFELLCNSIGTPSNYDKINNISVDHLLYEIAKLSNTIDDLTILEEQLIDMKTGSCPQGRSLRLIQILKSWRNY